MTNKKWNKFNKLTGKCYSNMIGAEKDGGCWLQAFELLMEIVREERQVNSDFAPELEKLDDAMDYAYDIQNWLEDCLNELEMRKDYPTLLFMCDTLLNEFGWPEYTGSEIKFRKSAALKHLGQEKEAVTFCEKWIAKEPENIVAATAGVYIYIDVKNYEKAEQLIDRFIQDKSLCEDENDIMFIAASQFYQVMGKKKEWEQIEKALKAYEKELEASFDLDALEESLDFLDEMVFPFFGNGEFLPDDDWLEDDWMEDELDDDFDEDEEFEEGFTEDDFDEDEELPF